MVKMKKTVIPIVAVILAFAADYLSYIIYDLLPYFDSGLKNNIIQPVLTFLITYGVMLAFGFIYYGKDKRAFRFPLAYAFGFCVQQAVLAFVKMVLGIINFNNTDGYVDIANYYVVPMCVGVAVTLVTLFKSVRHEALFCKPADLQSEEAISAAVRNRHIYGNSAYAKITIIVFGISFLIVRVGVRFGYYLAVQAPSEGSVSMMADIVDAVICLVEIAVCYLLSLGFSKSKKQAFYFLEFYFFAGAVSSVFDGFTRYVISLLTEAFNVAESITAAIFIYLPVATGDIIAIVVSVLIIKRLVGTECKK